MGTLWWDLRYALRRLQKSPGFALAAIISLGLGIGANTAIFSLLNALMLRPLPVRDPYQLIRIGRLDSRDFVQAIPGPMFDWLRKDPLFDGVCGVNTTLSTVEVKDAALPTPGHSLSGDCYEILGVRPAIGRLFTREDDIPNGPRVVVLSYAFWQRQFGGDPNVIGQSICIEGVPFTIIGVTEPRFQGFLLGFPPSVSFPITQEVSPTRADPFAAQVFYWGYAFARLKPGVTAEQVRTRLSVEWRRLLDESLPPRIQGAERVEILNQSLVVTSGATGLDYWVRNRFQRPLLALLAISALVLLVSCINVANLLLARGLQRRREIAVRLALGARRWQIVRELVAESAILIAAGLGCAPFLTHAGDGVLLAVLSRTYSGFALTASPDLRVLLFTSVAALAALLLFGVLPARQTSAVDLTDALKSGSRSASSAQSRIRRILICGQVALTLVLVMGASSFIETLRHLRGESLGFHVAGVLNAQLMPLPGGYAHGFNAATYNRDLLEHMQNLPGVEAASLSHFSPLFTMPYKEEIWATRMPDAPAIQAPAEHVSDGFLATMRIPLLQGRDFHRTDTPQSQKTGIVSESLAKRLFPAGEALGQHIRVGSEKDTEDLEIIGVAADARLMDPRTKVLSFVYLNYWQYPDYEKWGDIQLRYSGDSAGLIPAVRNELRQAGHEYPIHLWTIADQRDTSLLQERLLAAVGTAFGALALTLAGVGLFGLLSFFVMSRTSEIGIRVALGAERRDVTWLVLREAFVLVGAGLLIGLPLSYATARVLSGLVYGVAALPVVPLVFSMAVLFSVAAMAAVIPVRRATLVDPMVALRYE
jgi:predicted permease